MSLNISNNMDYTWIKKIWLYKEIFWESPWNEWFICQNCQKILPKSFYWKCGCWEINNFEPFYKNKDLKENFRVLSQKRLYKELIANILWEEVWFIWWWNTSLLELNDSKLWLNIEQLSLLQKGIFEKYEDFDFNDFYFYTSGLKPLSLDR